MMAGEGMLEGLFTLASLLLALCLGSFATAVSYRLPRGVPVGGTARSACPQCHAQLRVMDLIPIFSWIFLRGKCRSCGARIGWRYPLIEAAVFLVCVLFLMCFGLYPATIALFFLAPVLVAIIDIDLSFKIIPDSLNAAVLFLGVLTAGVFAWQDGQGMAGYEEMLIAGGKGVLLYGVGSFALMFLTGKLLGRDAMGMGDIKFFAAAGFWLGTDSGTLAVYMIMAGLFGIILSLVWQYRTKQREVPFGPSIILAFLGVLLTNGPIFMDLYR